MLLVHQDLDPTANTSLRNRVSKNLVNKAFDFSYFELTEESFKDNESTQRLKENDDFLNFEDKNKIE